MGGKDDPKVILCPKAPAEVLHAPENLPPSGGPGALELRNPTRGCGFFQLSLQEWGLGGSRGMGDLNKVPGNCQG